MNWNHEITQNHTKKPNSFSYTALGIRLILSGIFVFLISTSVYSQRKFSGKVVEIIDGKTVVVEMPSGRLTAVLQYVEIPEPEQPLYGVVTQHLEKLVLGKTVEFFPRTIMLNRIVGQVVLNGVDVSQQMIRDGAARHTSDKNGQAVAEAEVYEKNETQAKAEKRGIWSDADVNQASSYRGDRSTGKRSHEIAKWSVYLGGTGTNPKPAPNDQQSRIRGRDEYANSQSGIWTAGSTGFLASYDISRREGFTATPANTLEIAGGRFRQKVEFRLINVYRGDVNNIQESAYIIAFLSESTDYKFQGSNYLTVIADKQNIVLGGAHRVTRKTPGGVQELLLYNVGKASLTKLASAKKLSLRLGTYNGSIAGDIQPPIRQLLEMAN